MSIEERIAKLGICSPASGPQWYFRLFITEFCNETRQQCPYNIIFLAFLLLFT
jgi:hypothetical protein